MASSSFYSRNPTPSETQDLETLLDSAKGVAQQILDLVPIADTQVVEATAQALNAATSAQQASDSASDALAYKNAAVSAANDKLDKVLNLSDLADPSSARSNLGLHAVAASGAYGDLSGKPTIPTNTNQLTNGAGFLNATQGAQTVYSHTKMLEEFDTGGILDPTGVVDAGPVFAAAMLAGGSQAATAIIHVRVPLGRTSATYNLATSPGPGLGKWFILDPGVNLTGAGSSLYVARIQRNGGNAGDAAYITPTTDYSVTVGAADRDGVVMGEHQIIQNGGGKRAYGRRFDYIETGTDSPDSTAAPCGTFRSLTVTQCIAGGMFGEWEFISSPIAADRPNDKFSVVGREMNPCNNGYDIGPYAPWIANGHNFFIGCQIVPDPDTPHGGHGTHINYGYIVGRNDVGRFMNGFGSGPDSILAGGSAVTLHGAVAEPTNVPGWAVQLLGKWATGFDTTAATFTGGNLAIKLASGQGIAFNGTAVTLKYNSTVSRLISNTQFQAPGFSIANQHLIYSGGASQIAVQVGQTYLGINDIAFVPHLDGVQGTLGFSTGSTSRATLTATAFSPAASAGLTLGTASTPWGQVYSTNTSILTSDEATKANIRSLEDRELDAAASIPIDVYQLLTSIDLKGAEGENAARLHTGVIAQKVVEAYEAQGLDPFRYGVVGYDPILAPIKKVRKVTRQATTPETREESYTELVDGQALLKQRSVTIDVPKFVEHPVVDQETGAPVTERRLRVDSEGKPLVREVPRSRTMQVRNHETGEMETHTHTWVDHVSDFDDVPVVHLEPVMEEAEEEYEEMEPTGETLLSVRPTQLLFKMVAAMRRDVTKRVS